MRDLLAELEHVLQSEGMTREEALFFKECKDRAIKDFTVGACASSAIAWISMLYIWLIFFSSFLNMYVMPHLEACLVPWHRFSLSARYGMLAGMWRFNHSLDACMDKILGRDWDRMKLGLAGM
ncbi:hypothetical protein IHE45_13G066100 [Dioscorea alata]|uniref:Uncharacterized protein n=1 Tax=Dioscorea alata TaxID=55571 RepID=A0ACB7UYK1_DIOAL|nr:hypothetical protein IHE45_13G066100 [Dioscorea alata]